MTVRLRFYRRVRILPGVTMNLGKRGVNSFSFGGKGAHYTIGRHGTRATIGLPGTGLYLTEQTPWRHRQQAYAPAGRAVSLFAGLVILLALYLLLG